jgi:hypothetical protein
VIEARPVPTERQEPGSVFRERPVDVTEDGDEGAFLDQDAIDDCDEQ